MVNFSYGQSSIRNGAPLIPIIGLSVGFKYNLLILLKNLSNQEASTKEFAGRSTVDKFCGWNIKAFFLQ